MKSVAGVAVLALALASCSFLKGHAAVQVGQALPQLTVVDLDGSTMPLTLTPGHVTFVNVFATWCPPCKAETPDLAAFAARGAADGIDVIGIDQEETPDQVRAFAQHYGIRYRLVIDQRRETKDVLGARVIPRTVVVDGKGIVRAVISGPMTAGQMTQLAAAAGASS